MRICDLGPLPVVWRLTPLQLPLVRYGLIYAHGGNPQRDLPLLVHTRWIRRLTVQMCSRPTS